MKPQGMPLFGLKEWQRKYAGRQRAQVAKFGTQSRSFQERCRTNHPGNRALKGRFIPHSNIVGTDFLEANDDVAPSSMTCSLKVGKATVPYYFKPSSDQDLRDIIPYVLGTTFVNPSTSGVMNRTTPLAHPIWTNFYATALRMRGVGLNSETIMVATDSDLTNDWLPDPVPYFTLYDYYQIDIDFESWQFPVLNDIAISLTNSTWTTPPLLGVNVASIKDVVPNNTVQAPYTAVSEWDRYTTWQQVTHGEFITADGAGTTLVFATDDNQLPGGNYPTAVPGEASAAQVVGKPRIWIPGQMIKMTWHQVPWRYVYSPNSYLQRFQGYINQNAWFPVDGGEIYEAGTLLYLGYNPVSYMSPAAQIQNWANGVNLTTLLCDIELTFLYTNRVQTRVPAPETIFRSSNNFIAAGHNLQPFFPLRQFFYSFFANKPYPNPPEQSFINTGLYYPTWYSFPIELLFTDPDTPGINDNWPDFA